MALSTHDREAFALAQFAGLKAALKLTPEQEKNWPAVETALVTALGARAARGQEVKKLKSKAGLDLAERLRDRAKGLRSRADHVEKIASAAGPLLKSLDEAQTRRFGLVLRSYSRQRQARRAWSRLSSHFAAA
jgi:hypothetical protein